MRLNIVPAYIFLTLCSTLIVHRIAAQDLIQTIRGTVMDQDAGYPVPGAHVVILETDPVKGSVTDTNGHFNITNVPVGRVSIRISSMGYEEQLIRNVLLNSSKELVLNIRLQESVLTMEEIVITDQADHGEIHNDMAFVSARAFTVEETRRYAGSFNDPARMVSSNAGVAMAPEGDNYIAVRGNSPKGNQWRLEGVEIPNPNHFSSEGATGGPINALNSAMLANSDFFSGAFPAEYGNAFSGLFDMRLRNGNNRHREYSFSAGVIGTDITMEGPFSKEGESSYLFNYRYSTLDLLDKLNIVNFDGVPKYQDMSFKVNLPTDKAGRFSIFGLGGLSELVNRLPSVENEDKIISAFTINSDLAVSGVNHMIRLSKHTFLESNITFASNGSRYDQENLNDAEEFYLTGRDRLRKNSISGQTGIQSKINASHVLSAGINYTQFYFDFYTGYYQKDIDRLVTELNDNGASGLIQAYGNWKFRINDRLALVNGVHLMNNRLNNAVSIEPRSGLKWALTPTQSFNLGFGMHSKMESLPVYLVRVIQPDGSFTTPNRDLGFAKAVHYVAGYENRLTENFRLKTEIYYQDLYNIPIENKIVSSFSLLNDVAWYTTRELTNDGKGYNYGLELTLERYFADSYYFMLTGSLYDSKYLAMDGQWRNSRFNGHYAGNLLGGKEFMIGVKPGKSRVLALNGRISLIGARRFSPIDLETSREKGYTVFREEEAFSLRGNDIFIVNLSISYRVNRPRTSQEFKIDVQNVTNNQGLVDMYYDPATDKIEKLYQLSILPVLLYTIEF